MTNRIRKTLSGTGFADAPIIPVAASVNAMDVHSGEIPETIGLDALLNALKSIMVSIPRRDDSGDFLFSADHCFLVKGQGTVMTGEKRNPVNKTDPWQH